MIFLRSLSLVLESFGVVRVNASFKKTVKGQATLHLQQNLHDYVQEKINATEHVYSSQNG